MPVKGRWGICPVCMRERKYTVNGEMVPHRQWISGFECGIKNCTEDHPYGYMKPCGGSGLKPLVDPKTYIVKGQLQVK